MTGPVLLLGGTAEARELARRLEDLRVVTSYAGRTRTRAATTGEVRVGGFDGPTGLARWVEREQAAAVVDATHPFATQISAQAVVALEHTPLLRLQRPGWVAGPGDDWHRVPTLAAAAALAPALGRRLLVTTGRQGLTAFDGLRGLVVRCVEPPARLPPGAALVLARGPFTRQQETDLLRRESIDVVVTKDSGGESTRAKLDAARDLGLPVVVVDRPPSPGALTVSTVTEAEQWVRAVLLG